MRKFLVLIRYVFSKKKEFIKLVLFQLLKIIGFVLVSWGLYLICTWQLNIPLEKWFLIGFFHVLVIPLLYAGLSYRFLSKSLIYDLLNDSKPLLHRNVEKAVSQFGNKQEQLKDQRWVIQLFSWLDVLPKSIQYFANKILERIPYYSVMKVVLSQDLTLEQKNELAKQKLDEYLEDMFNPEGMKKWMLLLMLANWGGLVVYLFL